MDKENRLIISSFTSQKKCFSFPILMHHILLLRFALQEADNQFLAEFPSNTWDIGEFKHIWHLTSRDLQSPVPHKYDLLLRTASAYQKSRWVIVVTSLRQSFSKELVTSSCQPITSSHEVLTWLWLSLLTKVPSKWNWVSVVKKCLRAVLDTKTAPKSSLPNYMFFLRRWCFLPRVQEKRHHLLW